MIYCTFFFFFNDTATTEIYTLSLHDALPIYKGLYQIIDIGEITLHATIAIDVDWTIMKNSIRELEQGHVRSEEHTSELQSRQYLVCRLLLEKKKKQNI